MQAVAVAGAVLLLAVQAGRQDVGSPSIGSDAIRGSFELRIGALQRCVPNRTYVAVLCVFRLERL